MAFFITSTVIFILGILLVFEIHGEMDIREIPLRSIPSQQKTPLISIIIPARNEEETLSRCLESVFAQTYPRFEVIVVDDRSQDRTPQLLAEFEQTYPELKVVQGRELPAGWVGKPYALHQGVSHAEGEWYCFLDADTWAAPELLSSAFLFVSDEEVDCLTLLTRQVVKGFWEKVVLPVVFTGLNYGFPVDEVNDPHHPRAIANGQFILVKRHVYWAIGGHEAVKNRVDEDKAFAEELKGCGFRLYLAGGLELIRTRMYSTFPEMWEGWTKNIYFGLEDRIPLLAFGGLTAMSGAVGIPLWWLMAVMHTSRDPTIFSFLGLAQVAVFSLILLRKRVRVMKNFGIHPGYALTLPLGSGIFGLMMMTSAIYVLSDRGVGWKGRRYHG